MKRLLTIVLLLSSCTYTLPDGRKYKIDDVCLQGHSYMYLTHYNIGKCYGCGTSVHHGYHCDQYRRDTIWIPSQIRKEGQVFYNDNNW